MLLAPVSQGTEQKDDGCREEEEADDSALRPRFLPVMPAADAAFFPELWPRWLRFFVEERIVTHWLLFVFKSKLRSSMY